MSKKQSKLYKSRFIDSQVNNTNSCNEQELGQAVSADSSLDNFELPDELKQDFKEVTSNLPSSTEQTNAVVTPTASATPPTPCSWSEQPLVENQINSHPLSVSQDSFGSAVFILSNEQDKIEYNKLINKSMGKMKSVSIVRNDVRFSEKDSTFIAFVSYITYKFSNAIFK